MKMKSLMKMRTLPLLLILCSAMILGSCKKEVVDGSRTALNTLIAQADALANAATTASYPQTAIDNFKATLETVKTAAAVTPLAQADIDKLVTQLTAAMTTFNSYGSATYVQLSTLITEAEALANAATSASYPQSAIDAFKSVLATVKTASATLLTNAQITNLITQLTAAMTTFKAQEYGFIDESLYLNAGWHFDEGTGTTATSFSTAHQVGTFTKGWTALLGSAAVLPTWIDGVKGGKAIYLHNGAHLEVPYTTAFLPANITISAWIKMDKIWENDIIVSQNYWWGYKFQTQSGGKPMITERSNVTTVQDFDDGDAAVTPGAWTHVVVSLNSTAKTLKFYINGVLTQTYTETNGVGPLTQTLSFVDGTTTYTAQPFLIGCLATDAEIAAHPDNFSWINAANLGSFEGAIDELKIYNIALADGQVMKLYNDEKPL